MSDQLTEGNLVVLLSHHSLQDTNLATACKCTDSVSVSI